MKPTTDELGVLSGITLRGREEKTSDDRGARFPADLEKAKTFVADRAWPPSWFVVLA